MGTVRLSGMDVAVCLLRLVYLLGVNESITVLERLSSTE